jgi:hypothetical protein
MIPGTVSLRTPVVLALCALACGGQSHQEGATGEPSAPSFERSPIVFGAFDPPGTFFVTLSDREPKQINDNYDFSPLSLSPARRRLLQVTPDDTGAPRALVQIYELAAGGARLGSFPARGPFVEWTSESTLLFETRDGFETIGLDGSVRSTVTLPDWVAREFGSYEAALSPDRTRIAVAAMRGSDDAGFEATVTLVDAETGAELSSWATDIRPVPVWTSNHEIVAVTGTGLHRFVPGAAEPVGPAPLDFEACSVRPAEPGRVLLGERVNHGDYLTCEELWKADVDGSNAARLSGYPPVAYSPDYERMLVLDLEGLVVSKPDGSEAERLSGLPEPHEPRW